MSLVNYDVGENINTEYKEFVELSKPKSWLKTVSAFANTRGGIIWFGIRDGDKELVGINNAEDSFEKISEIINNKIKPLPRYKTKIIDENEKKIISVEIADGPDFPYYYTSDGRNEAFIRTDNKSIPAPEIQLSNLILKGKNKTFDQLSSNFDLSDVSFTLFDATLKRETGKEVNKDKDYISTEIIDNNGKITNAGLLLSDQGLLKQSRIFCTRWKGLSKGAIDGGAIDDKEYSGSIISLVDNAETFIKNNSKKSWKIEGMQRIEYEEYPLIAVREAIVNAVIHRDYQIIGSEIHIDMFDDRLEITSPGGLISGGEIQNMDILKVPSLRRNSIISDIFHRLHLMERRGSGLIRILNAYNDYKIKPSFYSNELSFTVVFPNIIHLESLNNENATSENMANINTISDEDYFRLKLYKALENEVRKSTLKQILRLYNKFEFKYEFRRTDVESAFNIKRTRAREIIILLLKNYLIEECDNSYYKFIK